MPVHFKLGGTTDDREHDEWDRGEPWLGAPETIYYGQTALQEFTWSLPSAPGGVNDREYDPAEWGIRDADGMAEQLGEYFGTVAE